MSLITINQRYKASTRIDAASLDPELFINNFIIHGTGINVLQTISRDIDAGQNACYTITGPYGTGTSTIELFLTFLLHSNDKIRQQANEILLNKNQDLIQIVNQFNVNKGWSIIKHVCGLDSPITSIYHSVCEQLGINPQRTDIKVQLIIDLLKEEALKSDGVILLLDELGKALDYSANNNEDLFLFQELAELAQNASSKIIVIGFLHQSFSEYAKNKNTKIQEEWAKVQGRYKDIGYNPSIDESLILIGDAIKLKPSIVDSYKSEHKIISNTIKQHFNKSEHLVNDLMNTFPIDPLVSLLLGPLSRRRFSQNERSLFGFLASHEKFGFRDFITNNYKEILDDAPLYNPEMFWDYIHHNLHHIIVNSSDSKAWLECCDAIDRASKIGDGSYQVVVKLISLFTIFGFNHQMFLTEKLILEYFKVRGHSIIEIKNILENLVSKSILIFRKSHNAYFVFEGSDIDINETILTEINKIKNGVDWVKVLPNNQKFLASGNYHTTGTMRWASKYIINNDIKHLSQLMLENQTYADPFVYFVISTNDFSSDIINIIKNSKGRIVVGQAKNLYLLKDLAIELIALKKIQKDESKIQRDKIAQKELENRINTTLSNLDYELDNTFNNAQWTYNGASVKGNSLSAIASNIADTMYDNTPIVFNELVNRNKPSATANSAIKKLVVAIAEKEGEEDLGFDKAKVPAEKGLFKSCIESYGMYQHNENKYSFVPPNDLRLKGLFERTFEFLKEHDRIITFKEILDIWDAAPYCLSKGISQIWLVCFVHIHQKQLAFFEYNGVSSTPDFINGSDEEFAVKSIQQPQFVGVRYIHIDSKKTNYLEQIASSLPYDEERVTPLIIAQNIVRFISELPHYTRNTSRLDGKIKKFRDHILKSNDPNMLLFKELPSILHLPLNSICSSDFTAILDELTLVEKNLLRLFDENIKNLLPKKITNKKYSELDLVHNFSSNPKVKTLCLRLTELFKNENTSQYDTSLKNIIALLCGKAERAWTDIDIDVASTTLVELMDRLRNDLYLLELSKFDTAHFNTEYKDEITKIDKITSGLDTRDKKTLLLSMLAELD